MTRAESVPVAAGVERRLQPFPYRAVLAICSDLDETPDRQVYWDIARYLNTTDDTAMGPGVGLEVGNTIYFDMAPDQFAYWNTDDAGREMVRALIRSGHIDCFHSFGDLATTRSHAGRALEELDRHGCRLHAWIDHAVAPTNFGADIMRGEGDVPGAPAYHADLTCGFGVRYVWRGRVTSVTGQDVPRRLAGIFDPNHTMASSRTLAKEAIKAALARAGNRKYALHAGSAVVRKATLRDGRLVHEFLRANPYWQAVDKGETAEGLGEVLSPAFLSRLQARGGTCVLYTHLGKVRDRRQPLGPATRAALAGLADAARAARILVTTTRRLLDYRRAAQSVPASVRSTDGVTSIDLQPEDGQAVDGLTFYVAAPERATLSVHGRERHDVCRNPPDDTGRPSVSLPWPRLAFPRMELPA